MTALAGHIAPDALASSLDALTGRGDPPTFEDGLAAVIDAVRILFAVTGCGLMLVGDDGELRHVGATDDAARALESAQEELGEGPCVDCFVLGETVATPDVMSDARWTRLPERIRGHAIGGVLGTPTLLGGQPVGSLNVYRDGPYDWDESDAAAVASFNLVLEGLLGRAVAARRDELVVSQLQGALDRRVVIERAVGALMERHRVSAVTAFTALRRAARDRREAVARVGADVLEGADVPVGHSLR
ncbi:MAG: GAF and ANTAR domain-containing protein [Thermoleophilia bacterium]